MKKTETKFDPSAPIPLKHAFPRSWNKRRRLRAGEAFRRFDRVAWRESSMCVVTGQALGLKVKPAHSKSYPAGWYWRRVK